MPPTIGYVAKVFPRLSETFVVNEIRQLERDGVDVQVFSLHPPPEEVPHRLLADIRAPITIVDQLGEPRPIDLREAAALLRERLAAAEVPEERLLPRKYVRLALQLADVAARLPLLRLHAHFASRAGHIAMLVSQLLGIPYGFTAHAKDIYHEEVDQDLLRAKMRFADLVVTVSDYNRRALLARGEGLPALEQKLVRLYNGVDLDLFRPDPAGERPPHRILGIGRLVEKKGFPTLVGACEILRRRGVRFTCELIGAGPQEPLLRDRIAAARLGELVALRGPLPLEQVAAEMRAASVVALPCLVASDGNVDALPTVLLEAMACGVPVVSTRLSGIPEIVADAETGFLVAPGDEVGLADALERVLTDPGAARRLGQAARARAERLFDLRANVSALRGCFAAAQGSPVAA